jgi:peroxiredoxin
MNAPLSSSVPPSSSSSSHSGATAAVPQATFGSLYAAPDAAAELLRSTGVGVRALRAGDTAPHGALLDAHGGTVALPQAWRNGPAIVLFIRGGWCRACSLLLRHWREYGEALRALNTTLIAVSPQSPELTDRTMGENGLDFALLSDPELAAANGFGISFTLSPDAVDLYAASGIDVPVLNGNGLWVLPVPATYVVGPDGVIRYAHIEGDPTPAPRPEEVLFEVEERFGWQ